ncbi:hypothetical protein L208DRAFT_1418520, partial [Tricholoma matsutake]
MPSHEYFVKKQQEFLLENLRPAQFFLQRGCRRNDTWQDAHPRSSLDKEGERNNGLTCSRM